MEPFYKLSAIDTAHLHIIYRVERRIEVTHVVHHLYQVIHIDDIPLVDLHELVAEIHQSLTFQIAFQTNVLLATSHHEFPATLYVVIFEQTDVALIHQLEVKGVRIEEELGGLFFAGAIICA